MRLGMPPVITYSRITRQSSLSTLRLNQSRNALARLLFFVLMVATPSDIWLFLGRVVEKLPDHRFANRVDDRHGDAVAELLVGMRRSGVGLVAVREALQACSFPRRQCPNAAAGQIQAAVQ